ncbi:MAG: alpha/beta hydrolase family esterase [Myxococcaceae bacterium]
MAMRLGTARGLVLVGCLLVAVSTRAQTPERPCAFTGIRPGEKRPCLGGERSVQGRTYCVHVPAAPRVGMPVVLLLHGYSSNGESQSRYFDLDSAVDRRGFLLVKPNGTKDPRGALYWNTGRRLVPNAPDDVAYLTAVLKDVVTTFGADASRIFVVGHSNGAFMANRLACERSNRIAAIVSLAAAVDPSTCHPVSPVSVLTVHGTADLLVHYTGGTGGFLGPYASADATLAFWAKADGCTGQRTAGKPLHLTCDGTGADTTVSAYAGCPSGVAVEHWRLDGAGHIPNFALPTWPDALLDFLWAHPKVATAK